MLQHAQGTFVMRFVDIDGGLRQSESEESGGLRFRRTRVPDRIDSLLELNADIVCLGEGSVRSEVALS